jgi:pyridoxal phosphate enzyme (YggS family)
MIDIAMRITSVHKRIIDACEQFGRNPQDITLLAVSKAQPLCKLEMAIEAGLSSFGENYVQDAVNKITAMGHARLVWHFIGNVQTNKAKLVAEHFDWVHTIDSLKIAERLSKRRPEGLQPLQVCIQVNISNELTKAGVKVDAVETLAKAIRHLPGLQLRGLMAVPKPSSDMEEQRRPFKALRDTMLSCNHVLGLHMDTLSMGMSNDFTAAIAEGATIIRVGTDIFGARQN